MSDNIKVMTDKTQEALFRLRLLCEDRSDLLDIVDKLEYAWDHLASELIMLAIGIHSFKYRSDEESIKMLENYKKVITNKQRPQIFFTGSGSDAIN